MFNNALEQLIITAHIWILPGGVPQQSLLSSTCSTSKPRNQDPSETSSFAYLCSRCLRLLKTVSMTRGKSPAHFFALKSKCYMWTLEKTNFSIFMSVQTIKFEFCTCVTGTKTSWFCFLIRSRIDNLSMCNLSIGSSNDNET